MIITCPSCSARFTVDDAALGQGRKVRCSDCKHIWFQDVIHHESAVDDAVSDSSAEYTENNGDSEELPPEDTGLDGIEENSALAKSIPSNLHPAESDDFYNPADTDSSVFHGGYDDDEHHGPRTKASFFGVLFVVLCLFGATAAWLYGASEAAVKVFPPLVRVYNVLGLETPYYAGKGISIRELTAKRAEIKGKPVLLIRGYAVNDTDEPVTVPPIRIELNKGNETVADWTTPVENFVLGGKETTSFEYGLPNPPLTGDTVNIRFAGAADASGKTEEK